jgi:sugar O-acyltransferase (sialic acid O-acetyltransferase NeuD family)
MEIKKLTVLGFSEGALTMLLDILNSQKIYPDIEIVNNLNLTPSKKYKHPMFKINLINDIEIENKSVVLGVTKPHIKKKICEVFNLNNNQNLINLISIKSDTSKTVEVGKGVSINVNSCIAGHCKIDDFVFINRNVSIGHHTVIGKYTTINPGVNIAGNVTIGEECLIGIGANIIDGVKIGNNVIIGAGSLVTKDIPNNVVVYGTPCKIIRNNET